jgi:hypothetical protein
VAVFSRVRLNNDRANFLSAAKLSVAPKARHFSTAAQLASQLGDNFAPRGGSSFVSVRLAAANDDNLRDQVHTPLSAGRKSISNGSFSAQRGTEYTKNGRQKTRASPSICSRSMFLNKYAWKKYVW